MINLSCILFFIFAAYVRNQSVFTQKYFLQDWGRIYLNQCICFTLFQHEYIYIYIHIYIYVCVCVLRIPYSRGKLMHLYSISFLCDLHYGWFSFANARWPVFPENDRPSKECNALSGQVDTLPKAMGYTYITPNTFVYKPSLNYRKY